MSISGPTCDFSWPNVNNAPDRSGVYILYQDGNPTYIGRAVELGVALRGRLQAQKRGDLGRSTQGATAFQTEAIEDPVNAANRERKPMWDFQFLNGRPPRCNDPLLRYS